MPDLSRVFFGWEGSPTKINYRTKDGTPLLTSLLEDLEVVFAVSGFWVRCIWGRCSTRLPGSENFWRSVNSGSTKMGSEQREGGSAVVFAWPRQKPVLIVGGDVL